jgi:hypothetical protein
MAIFLFLRIGFYVVDRSSGKDCDKPQIRLSLPLQLVTLQTDIVKIGVEIGY